MAKMSDLDWDALKSWGFTTEETMRGLSQLGAVGYQMADAYIDGWQTPTRWQRFCYWHRQFWLEERYF